MANGLKKTGVRLVAEGENTFTKALNNANKAVSNFGAAAPGVSKGVSGMGSAITGATGAVSGMGVAAAGISTGGLALLAIGAAGAAFAVTKLLDASVAAVKGLIDLGTQGVLSAARVQELELVTQLLGQRAGFTAGQINEQTESIKALGIRTDVALQLQGQFARYNLDLAKATDLARVAQDAAVLTMQDSSETLDNLLYGILTYNKRVLRTQGLNVDIEGSFASYAKQLEKNAESLTEAEKIQATLNAVIEEGARIAGVYEVAMLAPGKALRSLTGREIPELIRIMGTPFLDAFGEGVKTARMFVQTITEAVSEGGKLYPVLQRLGAIAAVVGEGFRGLVTHVLPLAIDFGSRLGKTFLDIAERALTWGVNIVASLATGMINGAASALIAAMNFISSLLTSWLAPGSPPKLLPDLPKWGMGWMAEILRGMTQADFTALKALQGPLKSALSILEQTGQIGKGAAGSILAEISGAFSKALTGGEVDEGLFARIAGSAGPFGKEIAELARRQIELAKATNAVREAEKALEDARKKEIETQSKVRSEIEKYNSLLRSGARKDVLKNQLAVVNAAEAEAEAAKNQRIQAEENVSTAKEEIDVLKERADLQAELVNQLIDLTRAQIVQPEAGGAGEGLAGGLSDAFQGAADAANIAAGQINQAFEDLKNRVREKFADIFKPLTDAWANQIQPKLEELQGAFDRFSLAVMTVWYRLFGPERGIITGLWKQYGVPAFETMQEWLETNIPAAGEAFATAWEERIGPAMMDVAEWIESDFNPVLKSLADVYMAGVQKQAEYQTDAWTWLFKHVLIPFWNWLSGTFGPYLKSFKEDVLVPLGEALGSIWQTFVNIWESLGMIFERFGELSGWLDTIAEKINNMPRLSDYIGFSPSPLEKGITGINSAMRQLASVELPRLASNIDMVAPPMTRSQVAAPVSSGGNYNFNMGGNTITNGMDVAVFEARVKNVVKKALKGQV